MTMIHFRRDPLIKTAQDKQKDRCPIYGGGGAIFALQLVYISIFLDVLKDILKIDHRETIT